MDNSNGMTGAAAPDDATQRIKDAGGTVIGKTKEVASETAQRGKESVAASVQSAASSLRRAADETQQDNTLVGKALHTFADGLEKSSHAIQDGDMAQGLSRVNEFARREPALFLGASFALGFALARFGKVALEQNTGDAGASVPTSSYDGFGG